MPMRLARDQAVGATAAQATPVIFGTPVTQNECGWLAAHLLARMPVRAVRAPYGPHR